MKKIFTPLTILYGAFWLAFGLNGFLHFFSLPTPSGEAAAFMQALQNAGYVMPIIYGTQIISGTLLMARRFIPLALLMLGPVVLNILLYDLFLNPSGLLIGAILGGIYGLLLFEYKSKFIAFFKP